MPHVVIMWPPGGSAVRNPAANAGGSRLEFRPWVGKIPWGREWQAIPVILPGKSREQRSLAGYSQGGHKGLDMAEQQSARAHAHTRTHTHTII